MELQFYGDVGSKYKDLYVATYYHHHQLVLFHAAHQNHYFTLVIPTWTKTSIANSIFEGAITILLLFAKCLFCP